MTSSGLGTPRRRRQCRLALLGLLALLCAAAVAPTPASCQEEEAQQALAEAAAALADQQPPDPLTAREEPAALAAAEQAALAAAEQAALAAAALVPQDCGSEAQIIECGQLPTTTPEQVAIYRQCCWRLRPAAQELPPVAKAVAAMSSTVARATAASIVRPDLDYSATGGWQANRPNWLSINCSSTLVRATAIMPTFSPSVPTVLTLSSSTTAPLLTRASIQAINARALQRANGSVAASLRRHSARIRRDARITDERGWTAALDAAVAGAAAVPFFTHPAGLAGPAELALMQQRIKTSSGSPQAIAARVMLSGAGVPVKRYTFNGSLAWNTPGDTPAIWGGPFAMAKVQAKYSGLEADVSACPSKYPAFAPRSLCGHVSAVELDGQMAAKQALAFWATGNASYAKNVFAIAAAWATTNKAWGLPAENGPLEAAWSVASLARALELLRARPEFASGSAAFMSWFNTTVQPQVVAYVDTITARAVAAGAKNPYHNWHAAIAEAWMGVAILSDDATLYTRAVKLFNTTVASYLRWGRTADTASRTIGECSETLRDIYHTEFGLGSLIQTAEMAWQARQEDLFSRNNFALAAALELHARFVNAWDANNEALLPAGFKFFDKSMPLAPAGMEWVFDMEQQLWYARNKTSLARGANLMDGMRYLLGIKFLPTGFEVGHNHYAGRLGFSMPETAALLKRYQPEWQEFSWGSGTLTSADTASKLWRPGVSNATACA